MLTLVCTGGIGSGKSYCAEIFSNLGVPVYAADPRTKELYFKDEVLQRNLKSLLGIDVVVNGILQREAIAKIIFSDREILDKVNALVHPAVLSDFRNWRAAMEQRGFDMVMLESAIYFEAPVFREVKAISIVVIAPMSVRMERIIKRDSPESVRDVKERMDKQMSDEDRVELADYVIYADGNRAVLPQVIDIMNDIKQNNGIR